MRNRLQQWHVLEAGLIGIFFVQSLRLLIGLLYSRVASASLVSVLAPSSIDPALPGIVDPSIISGELSFLVYMIALPLLTIPLGRFRGLLAVSAILAAGGRLLMAANTAVSPLIASELAVGGALLYLAMLIRYRASNLPYFFLIGFGVDQILRAFGNTLDPSWSADYYPVQLVLSLLVIIFSILSIIRRNAQTDERAVSPERGLMPLWGGVGLGGLLFLELSLLALPNAIAARARIDYTIFVPLVLLATLLPLVPWVRIQTRNFVNTFDGALRGWLWMLLIALLAVFGTRFQGIAAGIALVLAQFAVSMLWWWLVRPQAEGERNWTGLWLILAALLLGILVIGDIFTYEYAFVRNFGDSSLDTTIATLLRGFRGLGLGVLLLAVFLAALPMTQVQRRVPWTGGSFRTTLAAVGLVAIASVLAAYAARPPVIAGVRGEDKLRFGTYNIHSGYNEFFDFDLDAIARTVDFSGANVVLLQEVETGRLTSFGVDQALWLARRLGMDKRFYPTNEGMQGLAVLSNTEIVFDEGHLLTSTGTQTGVQRVQLRPDEGIITVYNTWLGLLVDTPEGTEAQEQDQQLQLNEIFGIIASDHPNGNLGRMIIGGTFNNVPTSPLIQQMRDAGFSDPFDGQPRELSYTLWRTGQQARIDYLWLRPPLQKLSAGVMDTNASDHRMPVVEVQIAQRSN
ncbi:MAG: endonuclease/exonuclease/phosphatase family protein [Anaerolineae bacterium]|nr:endonuclease/exonuclease/phosphatase family protein [Anaerolineae bacterium]